MTKVLLTNIWAKKIEDVGSRRQVKVYYTKNNKDQYAIYRDYGGDELKFKIIEDNHYSRNGLTKEEQEALGDILNNEECIIC